MLLLGISLLFLSAVPVSSVSSLECWNISNFLAELSSLDTVALSKHYEEYLKPITFVYSKCSLLSYEQTVFDGPLMVSVNETILQCCRELACWLLSSRAKCNFLQMLTLDTVDNRSHLWLPNIPSAYCSLNPAENLKKCQVGYSISYLIAVGTLLFLLGGLFSIFLLFLIRRLNQSEFCQIRANSINVRLRRMQPRRDVHPNPNLDIVHPHLQKNGSLGSLTRTEQQSPDHEIPKVLSNVQIDTQEKVQVTDL